MAPRTASKAPTAASWSAGLAALVLLALLPAGTAQGHEHGLVNASISIAHDAPPDGRTFVGNVNHFAIVAHGDDNVPDFHQDVPWRVTLDGVTLVETTADSGHDYDGVNTFDIVFPAPGTYTVEALDGQGKAVAVFSGLVEPTRGAVAGVALEWAPESSITAGRDQEFVFWPILDDPETPIPHSDCTFEVLRQGRVEFRTKTHTHEEKQAVTYAFPEPGGYLVRVLCFQAYSSARATLFTPSLQELAVDVGAAVVADTRMATPPVQPPAAQNAVVTAPAGDGMTLVGTYDPYTIVGPDTLQHLNVLAMDDAGQTLQHVDFTATLDGPLGRVFASETLHEYDGIYELTTRQTVPGIYTLRVTAEGAKGTGELAMAYTVLPRATPLTAGLVDVALEAEPVTGTPDAWLLSASTTSGPFAHGELEIRLVAAGESIPYLQTKLHTHGDGRYAVTVALPTQEPYVLAVTPFPLTPDLVLPSPAFFELDPAPGTELAAGPGELDADEAPEQEMPAAPSLLLGATLVLAAAALRRRRT